MHSPLYNSLKIDVAALAMVANAPDRRALLMHCLLYNSRKFDATATTMAGNSLRAAVALY
jgi:hypothetical protein